MNSHASIEIDLLPFLLLQACKALCVQTPSAIASVPVRVDPVGTTALMTQASQRECLTTFWANGVIF